LFFARHDDEMVEMARARFPALLVSALTFGLAAISGQQTPGPSRPARDTPAQTQETSASKSRIAGRVTAADTGRPVAGARVSISAPELSERRVELTDDTGAYAFTELAAGRYSVTVSRSGFVSLSYGQRRPLQPGTPLRVAAGQDLARIDFRLPRGSVISGRVYDAVGEPMAGTTVRVLRYQYVQGARQLVPAGGAQADDRGQYRVWGLNPGEYYVSAILPSVNLGGVGGRGNIPIPPAIAVGILGTLGNMLGTTQEDDASVAYAPTYFPGVISADGARPVTVGLSAETNGIDFGLQRVRTSVVSGRVLNADGSPGRGGNVVLAPETATSVRFGLHSGRVQADGAFSLSGVPPGRYVLRATSDGGSGRGRGGRDGVPLFGSQTLLVDGDTTVYLTLSPGATISGTILFRGSRSATPPDVSQFRISAVAVDGTALGGNPSARVNADGTFTLDGVSAGPRLIRAQTPRGWMLFSVLAGGRSVTDTPVEIKSGERLTGISVTFTDASSEVSGSVTDQRGSPVTEYTVLAFPRDPSLWRPQSRHIMTARPDQTGRFQIRDLPAGDYFLAIADPLEPGEWFEPAFLEEHRAGAALLTLGEGEIKTQDFKIAVR
jgi:protocatechuate 3,4-dioxygenase beta subunit